MSTIKNDEKGSVYLAEHKTMGVKRIIKQASEQPLYVEKLMDEACILGNLSHSYIPIICDVEKTQNSFYIIEEYIEGKNLYDYIRENGVFSQEKAISYGIKLAEIIEFLHSGNSFKVCHLDIQPKNIIINDEKMYLVDFGNAISNKDYRTGENVLATGGFAPPEQYSDMFLRNISDGFKADIYSFGAVLLYMITGTFVKAGEADNIHAVKMVLQNNADTPLEKIISDAMSKDARRRQLTAGIIKAQLLQMKSQNAGKYEKLSVKPYVISVAGVKSGIGTTYISLLLSAALSAEGVRAVYEENNDNDLVRQMAKMDKTIKYDRGYFMFKNQIMKPKYKENIHISADEEVVIRDEGILDESSDMRYGQVLVVVMNGDILGRPSIQKVKNYIKNLSESKGIIVIGVFNMCSEKDCKINSDDIPFVCHYIPYGSAPFCWKDKDMSHVTEILNMYWRKEECEDSESGEKRQMYVGGVKDYWHNIRKRR